MKQREPFVQQLHAAIGRSGMRKGIVAAAAGVSPASISQYLHGAMLPTPGHLFSLIKALSLSENEAAELLNSYEKARTSSKADPAPGSDGRLSDAELAVRLGVSQEQVRQGNCDTAWNRNVPECRKWVRDRGVEDDFVAEEREFGIPLLPLEALNDYVPGEQLISFAYRRTRNFLLQSTEPFISPVAVQCDASLLSGHYHGIVQLLLSSEHPAGFFPLELRCYGKNDFRLWQPDGAGCLPDLPPLAETEPLWVLPVVEIILLPVQLERQVKS